MATTTVGRTTIQGATTVGGFNPATLFSAGEQGVWYDPSDFSTLFQDSAGTIPVTALEQPVGRMLDKSGRGNTATQATSANRPVVSARVNLLTYTEDFRNTATAGSTRPWGWQNVAVTYNSSTAPNGTSTANLLDDGTLNGTHELYYSASSLITGVAYTVSAYVKNIDRRYFNISVYNASSGTNYSAAIFDLQTASVTSGASGSGFSVVSATMTASINGWYFCSMTFISSSPTYLSLCAANSSTIGSYGVTTYAGSNKQLYIWGADLRPANQGVGLPVYQRVGAAVAGTSTTVGNADYNANGFPVYLNFDGSNDYLQVASFTMPLVQRMSVVGFAQNAVVGYAGLVSIYPTGINDYNNPNGYVLTTGDQAATFKARAEIDGSTSNSYSILWTDASAYAALIPNTIMSEDKQTSVGYLRINGVQVGSDNSFTQFNANSNGGLLLGARWLNSAIAAPYLSGRLYGVILRGASSTANQITGAENWLNQKTAAY